MSTSETEVEGSIVHIVHVDESGTEAERTPLALTTSDDIGEIALEEDSESTNLSTERRSKRIRTHNEPTLEIGSLLDVNMEAAELMGIVDGDGKLDFSTSGRRLGADVAIEIEYYADEAATSAELTHRFEEVETVNPTIDPSATPPLLTWTQWIHGDIWFAYNSA